MVSMATHNRFKNGGVPTTLLKAQLLLILDCLTSHHIQAYTYIFLYICRICKLSISEKNKNGFNNGGVPTKSMILQLLRIIDY